jgi:uncharacterized protein YifN (PemK superfamily)
VRIVTYTFVVPDGFDFDPMAHRIRDCFEGFQTGTNEFDGEIDPELVDPRLQMDINEFRVKGTP